MRLDRWFPGAMVLVAAALVHPGEARDLSLYRVESSAQHDKAKQQAQSNTLQTKHVFEESLSEIENEKVRSEEARLLQERREMFLRNLQMGGSHSMSAPAEGEGEFIEAGETEQVEGGNQDAVDSFNSYMYAGTNEGMQTQPRTISIPVLQTRAREYGWNKMALQAQLEDPNVDANLRRRKA